MPHCYYYQDIGLRNHMEDTIAIQFDKERRLLISCVFDGHGGDQCSRYLQHNFIPLFLKYMSIMNGSIKNAICESLYHIHKCIIDNYLTESGSTVNVLIIDYGSGLFYCANIGDSRIIATRGTNKGTRDVIQISIDHKPMDKDEYKRIIQSGGYVKDNRVNGILAMSRAIGDYNINMYLSHRPDIYIGRIDSIEFFIQGSDGLFDMMTNNELSNQVNNMMKRNKEWHGIPKDVINHALKKGAYDNISMILVIP